MARICNHVTLVKYIGSSTGIGYWSASIVQQSRVRILKPLPYISCTGPISLRDSKLALLATIPFNGIVPNEVELPLLVLLV